VKFEPERVEKPWGHELIWARTESYAGKLLHVRAGEALSLQYHERKDETLHLLSGELRFWTGSSPETLELTSFRQGESWRLRPGTLHRMEAVTDCDILEASTAHLEDIVRVEDRYGRASRDHGE
jgi:mannose-6-phosphate isomerase